MAGPVPAIHVLSVDDEQEVDARHEAGHDEIRGACGRIEHRIAGVN
jgi:hypothetical protein